MSQISPIKTSFASGEWGRPLFGRTDVAQYQNACAIVENMICRPYGSVISTPGTRFIREVKNSSKPTRLIPFVFNRADANIIEIGDEYMRFFTDSSALLGAPMTLDYMEYANDVLAQAAYVSSDGPVETQDQSLTGGTTDDEYFCYPGRLEVYQTFQAGATGRLTKFSFDLRLFNNDPGLILTGKLYSVSGTASTPNILLATFSTVNTSTLTQTYSTVNFTIAYGAAPEVVNGTRYAIVISPNGSSGVNYLRWRYGGSYANGNAGVGTSSEVWAAETGKDANFKTYVSSVPNLIAESENTIKQQGNDSLKVVAAVTNSLNDTLTRTIAPTINLSSASQFQFDIYASRTGSNIKIGIRDSGGTTTEYTPSISTVNTWETFTVDLSGVASANKDAIDKIIITIVNANAENTFYIDNMYGLFSEISTPYTEDELFDVHYAQLNDVMYLAHKNHSPQKLTRLSATLWSIEDFNFLGGPFMPDNLSAITITPSATNGSITITLSATNSSVYFQAGHVGAYWKIGGLVTSSTTGLSTQGYVQITGITSSTIAVATVKQRLSGTSATTDWAEGSWSSVRGWPARVAFHERRLFFARTDSEPQTIWGSQPFTYDEFSVNGESDDDALNLQIASNEANEVMWLSGGDVLKAGTFGGDFVISSGGTGEALSPTNAVSKSYATWGSKQIQPKKIGHFLYYVQRFGQKLRELFYFYEIDAYKSIDKTIFSPHVTGSGIIDIAYQQNPQSILWCVREDGLLATLTREIDQEVQAWSRQITDGFYESVACIPSQDDAYDEVWVIVNRTINGATKRYIEVFEDIELADSVDLQFYVHSGLVFDAYALTLGATLSLSATSGSITLTLSATTSTAYFDATDVGQRVRAIDADRNVVGEIEIAVVSSSTVALGTVSTVFSALSYAGLLWGKSAQIITGLEHLEGKEVVALVDGGLDDNNKTVASGSITLGRDYFTSVIGLPYDQIIETLPIEGGSQKGTAQGKIQRINKVAIKVNNSYRGFYIGKDADNLERFVYRDPNQELGLSETLFTGILPNKTFKGGFEYGAQIYIKNSDPLPIEILSIMPELITQDT